MNRPEFPTKPRLPKAFAAFVIAYDLLAVAAVVWLLTR